MRSVNPRTGMEMAPAETIIYDALCRAAAAGERCPDGLDLNMLCGFVNSSGSSSAAIVEKLAARGLIEVDTGGQRYRRVRIVATGEWTASDPRQKSDGPHVPRGTHCPKALINAILDIGVPAEAIDVGDFRALVRLEKKLERAMMLVTRRKNGFLTGGAACR